MKLQVRIQNLLGDEVCNQLNHDINLLRLICARLHAHLEQADQSLWEVSSQQLLDLNQEIFNLQTCIQNSERLVATSHGPWLMAEHQHQQVSAITESSLLSRKDSPHFPWFA